MLHNKLFDRLITYILISWKTSNISGKISNISAYSRMLEDLAPQFHRGSDPLSPTYTQHSLMNFPKKLTFLVNPLLGSPRIRKQFSWSSKI